MFSYLHHALTHTSHSNLSLCSLQSEHCSVLFISIIRCCWNITLYHLILVWNTGHYNIMYEIWNAAGKCISSEVFWETLTVAWSLVEQYFSVHPRWRCSNLASFLSSTWWHFSSFLTMRKGTPRPINNNSCYNLNCVNIKSESINSDSCGDWQKMNELLKMKLTWLILVNSLLGFSRKSN